MERKGRGYGSENGRVKMKEQGKTSGMKTKYREWIITGILGCMLAFMAVYGWQSSMKYDTFLLQSKVWRRIGRLSHAGCALALAVLFPFFTWFLHLVYSRLDKRQEKAKPEFTWKSWQQWLLAGGILYGSYLILLICCYPGFYNYDIGNQLPQIMYPEVPFTAHHPLLHTIVGGGIITIGYHLRSVDLTFGVFLYNVVQMAICASCFSYTIVFMYRKTGSRILTVLSELFYILCPPVVMFAMSTTKDVTCYAFLLVAVVKICQIYENLNAQKKPTVKQWITTGILLCLACLLRNNIVYALPFAAVFAVILVSYQRKQQILFWIVMILAPFVLNKGLMIAVDAAPGSAAEALSVPFQQIARVYVDKGEAAFTPEELDYLYTCIDPDDFAMYDPVIADEIKTAFWRHLDVIMADKGKALKFWIKKGLQYPVCYIESFLDNTYQAWYPLTSLHDYKQSRYFMVTEWNEEYARPRVPQIYNFYIGISEDSYVRWPVIRLFCLTGTMLLTLLVALFYAWWRKDKPVGISLFMTLLVVGTCMCGPVSEIRYYLILFELFPILLGYMHGEKKAAEATVKKTDENDNKQEIA